MILSRHTPCCSSSFVRRIHVYDAPHFSLISPTCNGAWGGNDERREKRWWHSKENFFGPRVQRNTGLFFALSLFNCSFHCYIGPQLRLFQSQVSATREEKMLPEFNLEDKVILVSGAGRGLGLTQAEALLEAGAKGGSFSAIPIIHSSSIKPPSGTDGQPQCMPSTAFPNLTHCFTRSPNARNTNGKRR